jgi:hypothetical protein
MCVLVSCFPRIVQSLKTAIFGKQLYGSIEFQKWFCILCFKPSVCTPLQHIPIWKNPSMTCRQKSSWHWSEESCWSSYFLGFLKMLKVPKMHYLCEICRWWCILWWIRFTRLSSTCCFLSSQVKISTMPIMQFEVNPLHLNSIDKTSTVPIVYFEVNCKNHFNQVFHRNFNFQSVLALTEKRVNWTLKPWKKFNILEAWI